MKYPLFLYYLMQYHMRHLIDPTDLTVNETLEILSTAEDIIAHREKYSTACCGKKLATLFYEPSTRTRLSFNAAMLELGGTVLGFADAASSSVSKGETVADTMRVIESFADIIAMRHHKEGAPMVASQYGKIPVINAGDGSHSHPTQTLTDLLTIKREIGRLESLTVGFCGDLKYGRTVHSLIKALARFSNIHVVLIAPDELRLPSYVLKEVGSAPITFSESSTIEEAMPTLDVLYMTRVQGERFADRSEYERLKDSFILTPEKMLTAKKEMVVLHPLPRVNEITRSVDKDPRAAYFRQVENGKFVRMALIYSLFKWNEGIAQEPKPTYPTHASINTHTCTNPVCISTTEDVDSLSYTNSDGSTHCCYCDKEII